MIFQKLEAFYKILLVESFENVSMVQTFTIIKNYFQSLMLLFFS